MTRRAARRVRILAATHDPLRPAPEDALQTAPPAVATNPGELRDPMVNTLLADGQITSETVQAAFRTVPRERFAPAGTDFGGDL